MAEKEPFDCFAVVELFGHQQIAGRVTEASIGGCSFLRVDVPEQPEIPPGEAAWDEGSPAVPAYTRYFGNGAIYALNPCTEQAARGMAHRLRVKPPIAYAPPPAQMALSYSEENGGYQNEDGN